MGMKLAAYNILVNKKKLIKAKFEAYTNSDSGKRAGTFKKMRYLAGLNFSYYILGDRSQEIKLPKEKRILPVCESRTAEVSAEELVKKLSDFDVITFDVFDTLIYRYLARPTDVFYFVGERLNFPNYRKLRIDAEVSTRKEKHRLSGTYEVSIDEIADTLHNTTGLDKATVIAEELIAEKNFCYANPYMKKVWEALCKKGKKPVILSDMYLSEEYMRELLSFCGYDVSDTEIIVSCDILKSKAEGNVYKLLKEMKAESKSFAHVGDNAHSDIENAQKHGITAFRCTNPDSKGNLYRTDEMSPLVKSAWAGLVNKKMYGSEEQYDKYFCYGYNCGGILIYGYAQFIEKLAKEKNIDKILFLSRDGYIVKKIYDSYCGGCDTEYIYWSRSLGTIASADSMRNDFTDKYILQKTSNSKIVLDALEEMGLAELADSLGIDTSRTLDGNGAVALSSCIYENWDKVSPILNKDKENILSYVKDVIEDKKRVLLVDCGWAGSGYFSLSSVIKEINPDCEVYGALCATNNAYHLSADTSDSFIQSGRLSAYCFSSAHNRDLYHAHLPTLKHNLYFEMLFSSEEGSALKIDENKKPVLSDNPNSEYVRKIADGIIAFARDYDLLCGKYPYLKNISGNDAYAPFGYAARDKDYFKKGFTEYSHEEQVMKKA
ncbi:MAG: hypothetical protein IJZ51_05410 [Ruminiclostridium sp.]|nr:hypothetical protein [Ruminiclostridium sp.]